VCAQRERDVAGGQEEDPVALATEVQSTGALEVRSGRPGEDGLPEGDLDIGELSISKDPLAADGGPASPFSLAKWTGLVVDLEFKGINVHLMCATQLRLGGCRHACSGLPQHMFSCTWGPFRLIASLCDRS